MTNSSYTPLPGASQGGAALPGRSTRLIPLALVMFLVLILSALVTREHWSFGEQLHNLLLPATGVSDKTSREILGASPYPFAWSDEMLLWQRTGFHFQPEKNWMNDPNGPVFYKGWYHLFYQYNPDSPVWGNITWGHAVSRDLLHWLYLPPALLPDRSYDSAGVWTGSATLLPDGRLFMLYTGQINSSTQVQNLAIPADPSDPLLLNWIKSDSNPVIIGPPFLLPSDFRDPATAWFNPSDSTWHVAIGSKDTSHAGIAIVYKTTDFVHYDLIPGHLHRVAGTGIWECIDFYPVATGDNVEEGLDTSVAAGDGVKHVLKASTQDNMHDYYAIGTYEAAVNEWQPDDKEKDVGIGLRYDWGEYYASKTFYDESKRRRILLAWIPETDSQQDDVLKGWASLQAIPRIVTFDAKTRSNLLQWPVEEVESLRMSNNNFSDIRLDPSSIFHLDVPYGSQLDIEAEFEIDPTSLAGAMESDIAYNCSTSNGAADRSALGPFGLLVLANQECSEQTAAYFFVNPGVNGQLRTHFCHDETRSSKATDIVKRVVGSTVPVLNGERLSLRMLVDHSIVESFAQGGRSCITSRVYPTNAIYDAVRVYLFNNATSASVTAKSLNIWEMNSTFIHSYPMQFKIS